MMSTIPGEEDKSEFVMDSMEPDMQLHCGQCRLLEQLKWRGRLQHQFKKEPPIDHLENEKQI